MNSSNPCSEYFLVDSHNHLHRQQFADDADVVLDRARAVGVGAMLVVGLDVEDSRSALAFARKHEGIFVSVGIHPEVASATDPLEVEKLAEFADCPEVVAVGETGFDLYWSPEAVAEQRRLFAAHIKLARNIGKPLVIHDREAHDYTLATLDVEHGWECGGVMHCFSGDVELARRVVEQGFYVSIPGIVTFKNAGALTKVAQTVPAERLLVETDAPYLAPVPWRGKRNEPAYMLKTAETVAALRGMTLAELAAQTTENFCRLFRGDGCLENGGRDKKMDDGESRHAQHT